ncbi:unnamed protein product [Discosporangium mesarthrocarpum]
MDHGIHHLSISLETIPTITCLNLAQNPFGEEGCRDVATLLCQPLCTLRRLTIAGCLPGSSAGPRAWKTIGRVMAERHGFPPRPGDGGVICLAAALISPHGCPLRSLRIVNAGFGYVGGKALSAALSANSTLEEMDLSGNKLSHKGLPDLLVMGLNATQACILSRHKPAT